ncbi:MAG: hypothetical protein NVSMB39_4430 [Candidatus Saccharimonadales bacterium]
MLPRVLLVEDDETIREIYALKFELEGFEIATAENGQIGMAKLEEFQPHIVLLDMMMPVMGGVDFLRKLQASGRELPHIIAFSNISASKQVESVMKLGVKAYWIKSDFTPDRCVKEILTIWKSKAK